MQEDQLGHQHQERLVGAHFQAHHCMGQWHIAQMTTMGCWKRIAVECTCTPANHTTHYKMKHTYLVQNTNSKVLGKSVGLSELYLGFHQYDRTQFCFNTQLSDIKRTNPSLSVRTKVGINLQYHTSFFFFFGTIVCHLVTKKNPVQLIQRIFMFKKVP